MSFHQQILPSRRRRRRNGWGQKSSENWEQEWLYRDPCGTPLLTSSLADVKRRPEKKAVQTFVYLRSDTKWFLRESFRRFIGSNAMPRSRKQSSTRLPSFSVRVTLSKEHRRSLRRDLFFLKTCRYRQSIECANSFFAHVWQERPLQHFRWNTVWSGRTDVFHDPIQAPLCTGEAPVPPIICYFFLNCAGVACTTVQK